jgi:hypothetical protein
VHNRSVNVELPDEVWDIIDTQFKPLIEETDSEILGNIIKRHLAEHAYYPNTDSLEHGHRVKDFFVIQGDMIMSIVEQLERKGLGTYQEWAQIMQERIMK